MHKPSLPTGDGAPGPCADAAPPSPAPAAPKADDDATDLFQPLPDATDDTPTIISKLPPRPASSEDVFAGTGLRGRRLAHFELLEPIGVGGMAAVIRAQDLQLERNVALKILPPEMATDPENVQRFHQEARAAARLDHENIARVFFCGEDQKLHFIAFEFVEGQNLRALIERRGRLPVPEAVHYMLQVATGLAHASSRGVVHRDIKPSNIIITPNGRAKLVDMGLARSLEPQTDRGLTQSGVTLGTFDYISPEQALEPRDADVRSDVYSLGCTFYHALTGQPPVPEGTAAKKLHHHQHVAPVDPRQLNPDVPDDVAAVLARMMAKDPAQRYQRPEHLVQHLLVVAQKLGASPSVPDGVMFVDAPLPNPPRPLPFLVVAVAGAALVGLVFLLGQTSRPPWASNPGAVAVVPRKDAAPPKAGPGEPPGPAPSPGPPERKEPPPVPRYADEAPSARGVSEFLRANENADRAEVLLAGNLNLDESAMGDVAQAPGLVYDGKGELLIRPKDPNGPRPVIHLEHGPERLQKQLWALLVKGGTVRLQGLCFVVDATRAPHAVMAAVCRKNGRVQIEDCLFVQAHPPGFGGRLSAVEAAGPPDAGGQPAVTLTQCCFMGVQEPEKFTQVAAGGQHAVTLAGGVQVRLTDCAFGPHAALIAFQGERDPATPRLVGASARLDHCSALLAGESAVCRLENASGCTLDVRHSLFSRPDAELPGGMGEAALVRQADEASALCWLGQDNRYHNLDVFWARPQESLRTLEDFRTEVRKTTPAGGDEGSLALGPAPSPWASAEPLQLLEGLDPKKLREAFQLDVERKDLRQADAGAVLVGVDRGIWGGDPFRKGLRDLSDKKPGPAVARTDRVVVPGTSDSGKGVYADLEQAVADARPGDVISIKHTGPLPVSPLRLAKATVDLTIRAHPGFHPVLTLADTAEEEEAFLFRLHDGKLRLEGLEFRLRPARAEFKAQTVVAAVGDGECTFTNCVFTLDSAGMGAVLSAVQVADPPGVMKMEARPARPAGQHLAVAFRNCFVRGDGQLLAASAPRPFDLDVDNSVLALGGSLVQVEPPGDDAPPAPPGQASQVGLTHVTAYLGGHLLHLKAGKDVKGLVPVFVRQASDNLFVSAGQKTLIHLDGPDTSEERMHDLVRWSGAHNAYSKFSDMLDQQPRDKMDMRAGPYSQGKWREFTGESDGVFNKVMLADSPGPEEPMLRLTPARFRVKAEPEQQGYGADLDKLVRQLGDVK